ncbi:MAG: T9SS type A sorting domain-containing protein [Bacteroidota bacterium]
MRRIAASFLLLGVFLCAAGPARTQTPELNHAKYWKHRYRLYGDGTVDNPGFVKVVDDPRTVPGSMIPVAWLAPWADCQWNYSFGQNRGRCGIGDTGRGGVHGGADGTIHLGWYIGMLAMEYRLADLTDQPAQKEKTARELWQALEAYARLDSTAETKYGYPGVVDGFFLRNDMPLDYHRQLDIAGNPNFPGFSCTESPLLCNEGRENTERYANVPSGDQMNYLLLGAALVKACLPPDAVFVRGEDVRVKGQRLAHLIISRLRQDRWYIRSPYGTKVPVGPQLIVYSWPMAEAANYITENNTDLGFARNYHDAISMVAGGACWNAIRGLFASLPPVDVCLNDFPGALQAVAAAVSDEVDATNLDDICWNLKNPVFVTQVLSLAAMSNTFPPELTAFVADLNGAEIYPLLQNILYGGNLDGDIVVEARRLLDAAPCKKFCWISTEDVNPLPYEDASGRTFACDNVVEWQSSDRWVHPRGAEGDHGRAEGSKLSSGMDFLLLYNAYHCAFPNQIVNDYRDSERGQLRIEGEFPRKLGAAFGCIGCTETPVVYTYRDSVYLNCQLRVRRDGRGNERAAELWLVGAGGPGRVAFGPDFVVEPGANFVFVSQRLACDGARLSYPTAVPDTEPINLVDYARKEERLRVFPNPSDGWINLEVAGLPYEPLRIEILGTDGRILYASEWIADDRLVIDLRAEPAGIYLVRVTWGDDVILRKAVVE